MSVADGINLISEDSFKPDTSTAVACSVILRCLGGRGRLRLILGLQLAIRPGVTGDGEGEGVNDLRL